MPSFVCVLPHRCEFARSSMSESSELLSTWADMLKRRTAPLLAFARACRCVGRTGAAPSWPFSPAHPN